MNSPNTEQVTINCETRTKKLKIIKDIDDPKIPLGGSFLSNEDIKNIILDYYNDKHTKTLCIECIAEKDKDMIINTAFRMSIVICEKIRITVYNKNIYFTKISVPWLQ